MHKLKSTCARLASNMARIVIRHKFTLVFLRWVLRLQVIWLGPIIIWLGIVLGQAMMSPSSKTTSGIIFALPYFIIISLSPVTGLMVWIVSQPFLEGVVNIPLGAGVPDLSLSRLSIGLLFTLLMGRIAVRQRKLSQIDGVDIAAILYFIGMGQSALNTSNPIGTIQTIIDTVAVPALAYFVAKNFVTTQADIKRVMVMLVLLGTFIAGYAIYEQTTGNVLFVPEGCEVCRTQTSYSATIRVLRGIFGGPGTFALIITQIIPIAFLLYFRSNHLLARLFFGLSLVTLIAGNYLTFRRTGWIAMLVTFLIMQWFYPQFRRVFIVMMIIIIPLAALSWGRIEQSEVYQDRVGEGLETANGRTEIHSTMMRMWQAKPIFGWGYAAYVTKSGRFRADGWNFNDTQSLYWKILVSGGLVAFVPFIAIFVSMIVISIRLFYIPNNLRPVGREILVVFWAVTSAYLINNYTATDITPIGPLIVFVAGGALVGAPQRLRLLHKEVSSPNVTLPPPQSATVATN